MPEKPLLPSDISEHVGFFDRIAEKAAMFASRAPFFAFCFTLVVAWVGFGFGMVAKTGNWSYFLGDKYQLVINSTTTIITFLMVALLQNSQTRSDQAIQHKLNAISKALADLLESHGIDEDVAELRSAVGLEHRESTTKNINEENQVFAEKKGGENE